MTAHLLTTIFIIVLSGFLVFFVAVLWMMWKDIDKKDKNQRRG